MPKFKISDACDRRQYRVTVSFLPNRDSARPLGSCTSPEYRAQARDTGLGLACEWLAGRRAAGEPLLLVAVDIVPIAFDDAWCNALVFSGVVPFEYANVSDARVEAALFDLAVFAGERLCVPQILVEYRDKLRSVRPVAGDPT